MARGDRAAVAWLMGASALIGAAFYFSAPAAAEEPTIEEQVGVELYSDSICQAISDLPTVAQVTRVAEALFEQGYEPSTAVTIINGSVYLYCPQHWGLLVAIGNAARAQRTSIA